MGLPLCFSSVMQIIHMPSLLQQPHSDAIYTSCPCHQCTAWPFLPNQSNLPSCLYICFIWCFRLLSSSSLSKDQMLNLSMCWSPTEAMNWNLCCASSLSLKVLSSRYCLVEAHIRIQLPFLEFQSLLFHVSACGCVGPVSQSLLALLVWRYMIVNYRRGFSYEIICIKFILYLL